ncbi:MAG: hypothetical protein JRH07_12295, partial [Deltaproteobacteria bacterium]|nr:hypothetical protein [Deltaproteobacteria bacterium]
MKAKAWQALCIGTVIGALFLAGCATRKPAPSTKGRPAWVDKGSGAFDMKKKKIFYGVGIASGISNKALLVSTADNRARAEVAKILETYVASLAKDYMASTTAGDMSASAEEQHVEQALKNFTKTTLHGARIVDHWRDPKDDSFFSLCEMDLLTFKEALNDYKELDSQVRDYVRENAERLH